MTVERMSVEQLEKWRADPGWTAITLEAWPHKNLVTITMPDRELDQALRHFESTMKITEADRTDEARWAGLRRTVMDQLVSAMGRYDRRTVQACAIGALWCVLNHPRDHLGALRLKMEALRDAGQAPHFTLCRGPQRTFGAALGDCYADVRKDVEQPLGPETTILTAFDYPARART